jgi:hypothetical protein
LQTQPVRQLILFVRLQENDSAMTPEGAKHRSLTVTNGMSDQRMVEGDHAEQSRRRELIQYLRACTPGHARRLRDMAWLPLYDGFLLDSHHSVDRR